MTPGENSSATRETAGNVASDSLAAESYREGGAFASNPNAAPENLSQSDNRSGGETLSAATDSNSRDAAHFASQSSSANYAEATGRDAQSQPESYAGAAPSYIQSQYQQDPNGPHGKNLKEGDWDESQARDGLRKALASEPGSMDDPGRLAEQNFQLKQGTGGTGPQDGSVDNENVYSNLKDASA